MVEAPGYKRPHHTPPKPKSVLNDPTVLYPCDIVHLEPVTHSRNPVTITFTEQGKKTKDWDMGETWGIRLYEFGYDPGVLSTLFLKDSVPTLAGG